MQLIFTNILWIWIFLSVHHNFLRSEGLRGTHIDASSPFSSKSMTLTQRGSLWTFSANLALCAPCVYLLAEVIWLKYFDGNSHLNFKTIISFRSEKLRSFTFLTECKWQCAILFLRIAFEITVREADGFTTGLDISI